MTVSPPHEQFVFAAGRPPRVDPAPAARLRRAREMTGYATPGAAAAWRRWNMAHYVEHEAGTRSITADDAQRYAAGYRVSARWLLMGQG